VYNSECQRVTWTWKATGTLSLSQTCSPRSKTSLRSSGPSVEHSMSLGLTFGKTCAIVYASVLGARPVGGMEKVGTLDERRKETAVDDKPFFHSMKEANDGSVWGVKGLQDGLHLTHQVGSQDFHLTMPIRIEGQGTFKIRDNFTTDGDFNGFEIGFTPFE
jgi:hypothetical protein